ncbi:MAG: hypothetical protein ACRC37_06225, partial [Lentisphaeria bacterium]
MKVNAVDWEESFAPRYSPKQLLEMGIFGGKYFNDIRGEFPKDWFENARMVKVGEERDGKLNYYGVISSQDLGEWRKKGWLMSDDHGWMQWYFHYYQGRRLAEDIIQIKRWRSVVAR